MRPSARRSPSPATPSASAENDQRDHQHEQQAQEDLADRLGHVADEGGEPRVSRSST